MRYMLRYLRREPVEREHVLREVRELGVALQVPQHGAEQLQALHAVPVQLRARGARQAGRQAGASEGRRVERKV